MNPQVLNVTIDEICIGDFVDEGRQVVIIATHEVTASVFHPEHPMGSGKRWSDDVVIPMPRGETIRVIRGQRMPSLTLRFPLSASESSDLDRPSGTVPDHDGCGDAR